MGPWCCHGLSAYKRWIFTFIRIDTKLARAASLDCTPRFLDFGLEVEMRLQQHIAVQMEFFYCELHNS